VKYTAAKRNNCRFFPSKGKKSQDHLSEFFRHQFEGKCPLKQPRNLMEIETLDKQKCSQTKDHLDTNDQNCTTHQREKHKEKKVYEHNRAEQLTIPDVGAVVEAAEAAVMNVIGNPEFSETTHVAYFKNLEIENTAYDVCSPESETLS